jgi:hypothetical protein
MCYFDQISLNISVFKEDFYSLDTVRHGKDIAIFWYIAPYTGVSVSEQHTAFTFRFN